ncbi:MAG: hypothetical protein WCT31_05115 [Candidatus Micrarchaeia archaeon]|jgi:hypothetical protein
MEFKNTLFRLLVVFSLLNIAMAADPNTIQATMGNLCYYVKSALAAGLLLLTVMAAIVYAVGQVLGAETRARASVWATAMFTGALMGALIYIILPYIIGMMMSGNPALGQTWVDNCCKMGNAGDYASCNLDTVV